MFWINMVTKVTDFTVRRCGTKRQTHPTGKTKYAEPVVGLYSTALEEK